MIPTNPTYEAPGGRSRISAKLPAAKTSLGDITPKTPGFPQSWTPISRPSLYNYQCPVIRVCTYTLSRIRSAAAPKIIHALLPKIRPPARLRTASEKRNLHANASAHTRALCVNTRFFPQRKLQHCDPVTLRDRHLHGLPRRAVQAQVSMAARDGDVHVVGTRDTQKRLPCAQTQENLAVRGALC